MSILKEDKHILQGLFFFWLSLNVDSWVNDVLAALALYHCIVALWYMTRKARHLNNTPL